ncbi:MAG: hypothetical protein ACPL6F_02060, partial [Anaerolineales bacterium]
PTRTLRYNDPNAYLPAIAVTDRGDAYLVWSRWLSSEVRYCSWKIPAVGIAALNCSKWIADRTAKGIWIAAREEVVYVLYDLGNRLYYRQIAGESVDGYASDIYDPDWFIPNVRLAIDSAGKLHFLRMEQHGMVYSLIYNSNATVDALNNMDQQLSIADTGGGPFDLAISGTGTNERAYIVRRSDILGVHRINYISCQVNGCSGITSGHIPLAGSGWQINELKAIGTSTTIYIAFIGRNSSTPGTDVQEIYLSSNLQQPNAIPEDEFYSKRSLHLVTAGAPPLPVIGWRKASAGHSTDVYAAYPVIQGGSLTMKSQQIFTRFAPYIEADGDSMASNGEWVAGVWLYSQSPTIARIVPWLAGNAYAVQLPLITK